jgi:hypothetical protein
MKYTIALLILIFCSSFTICRKMVVKDGKNWWQMYIYPNCTDTCTYILIDYYVRQPYKDRKIGEREWTLHGESIAVSERAYVQGKEKYAADFHAGIDTVYAEQIIKNRDNNEHQSVTSLGHPSHRVIQIDDSMQIALHYFSNGTISRCELINRDQINIREVIVWDSSYCCQWQGHEERVPATNKVIYEKPSERNAVIPHDVMRKVGVWKRYDNFTGALLDSVDHK